MAARDGPEESGTTRPCVYTIAPGAPFLDTLAAAILKGDLPTPGSLAPGPLDLPRWTVLLPTRRAVRAARESFLKASGGASLLLPAIRPIGDVDEDSALLSAPAEVAGAAQALELPPAIGAVQRRLALTRLVLMWSKATGGAYPAITPGQAIHWAEDLIALMDSAETEGIDLAVLEGLVSGDFAAHWQLTLDFLKILTEHWPDHLAEQGLLSPYERRDRLMRAETAQLAADPPDAPVIAAGSTGTVPATAELLGVVSRLPRGAIVLPGLDLELDEESWGKLTEGAGHPEHPQFGMKYLIDGFGIDRSEVQILGPQPTCSRSRLLSEVMRPAGSTDRWREAAAGSITSSDITGLTRIDAPTAQDEAEVIALILRSIAGEAPKTAALVTPDRVLARRVSARLEKWALTVDDSAGRPLARMPAGAFMDLVIEAVRTRFAPVPLMALLKHPLTRLGRDAGTMRRAARALELLTLRRPTAGHGLGALKATLARSLRDREKGDLAHPVYRRLSDGDWRDTASLIDDIEAAFAPLESVFQGNDLARVKDYVAAHADTAALLAREETGSEGALWRGDDGEALSLFLAELLTLDDDGPEISAADYPEVYRALVTGHVVRPRSPAHPRLFIWGPLEARLQCPDVVILGGLNEDSWPTAEKAGPWLSRPMLTEIGLPLPERRIGLAAHDVAQLMSGAEVFLTRAEKVDGAPTVPSRWLLRLDAVLEAAGMGKPIKQGNWLGWAARRDLVDPAPPMPPPTPRPPLEARPTRLSVTRIEHWIANPYAVYAHDILRLRKLDPIAGAPDARLRGVLVHDALNAFARHHGAGAPEDVAGVLMKIFEEELGTWEVDPATRAFWSLQLRRFAGWFAATEPARRAGVGEVLSEVSGELALPGVDFTLTARADRIDLHAGGDFAIYDFKTGASPTPPRVKQLAAPQLPLEAAIAAAGGFAGVPPGSPSSLRYIRASGRGAGGEEIDVGGSNPDVLAQEALEQLTRLVSDFADIDTAYSARRRPGFANSAQYRYDDYANLARLGEWSGGEG